MAKMLRCHDVFPGCDAEVHTETEEELLRHATEHAASVHGVKELDEKTIESIKSKVREE